MKDDVLEEKDDPLDAVRTVEENCGRSVRVLKKPPDSSSLLQYKVRLLFEGQ